jgi:hypothetical protein
MGSTSANFSPLSQFPPDFSMGAGATQYSSSDTQHILVAGGITPTGQDPGIRVFDVTCAASTDGGVVGTSPTSCIQVLGTLPVPLTNASTFLTNTTATTSLFSPYFALVVGSELQSGLTHTFLLNSAGAKELATQVHHYNAAAIQSPLGFGSVLLFGGADGGEIESFFPPESPPGSSSN